MRVTFVLPWFAERPVGGYLVVFRYANELTRRGHEVAVVHAKSPLVPHGFRERGKAKYRFIRERRRIGDGRPDWVDLDPAVRVGVVQEISGSRIPDADAIFATACTTARAVYALDARKGTKLYLVQHYEDWQCGQQEVDATWRLPMHKVVSSRWLEEIGIGLGEAGRLTHVPYGVEHEVFRMGVEPGERNPRRVGMLAHLQPDKGKSYGIEELDLVRRQEPKLEAVVFGARGRPDELPGWMEYVENPPRAELAALYNTLSVFLHTSITEGWGLTGAEAMACGCALVASDSGGIRDYAIDGETALLVPPRDATELATRLIELIDDVPLRQRLALNGRELIHSFTWERASDRLDALIRDLHPQETR
jgi:glycosyltransferase involved in cell wall biosynthesis